MSLQVPPADENQKDEHAQSKGMLDPEVQELLRRLLVGDLELKVDPLSGRVEVDGETPPSKDHP